MRKALPLPILLLALAAPAPAGEVHVAVAQNFAETARRIGDAFAAARGHRLVVSAGSTGKLYAQIENGAPFEVFLSADAERPRLLEETGLGVAGSRFPYALGRLVLWSADPKLVDAAGDVLGGDGFRHLAIANPKLAPYGAAAREVLARRGLWERVEPRLVQGEDIGQTYQFVASGNAQLGFVALSQLAAGTGGSRWLVPPDLHAPLEQQAVLLAPGRDDPAAKAFLAYLRSPAGRAQIEKAGYDAPAPRAMSGDLDALALTLRLAALSTAILLVASTPLAWWLSRTRSRWKHAIETLVALPLVLPPTVLGFYLLIALGPHGALGVLWSALGGAPLVFSFAGLVIGSVVYSLPFVVQPIQASFEEMGRAPLEAAATLGAAPLDRFASVALPLARRGFLVAAVLGFAHTLGEFGVVLMIGGNIPDRTRVVSIAIYDHVESLDYASAHRLAAILLLLSFLVLLTVFASHRRPARQPAP